MTRSLANEISDIVWLQTSFLGDIVITTGAIKLAAESFPGVRQHLITTKVGYDLLKDFSLLNGVLIFEKKTRSPLKAFSDVKSELYAKLSGNLASSVLLQPHRSFRSSLLSKYLGLPTVTYDETNFGFLATERVPRISVFHEAHRIALLLEPLGLQREKSLKAHPYLDIGPESQLTVWEKDKAVPPLLIGIAPGSNWGTKRWTLSGYSDLVKRLLEHQKVGIILLGSKQEKPLADEICAFVDDSKKIWNLVGATSFDDLRNIFPKLSLLVGNDSSTIHFASAFNIPSVVIFGPTIPEMGFAPLAPGSISLGIDGLPCRPCSDHGPMECPEKHFKCMKDLNVDGVFQACKSILKTLD